MQAAAARLNPMAMPDETIIPAATLVVMRPASDGGAPELLMVERAKAMAFAGGAMVFPGGRVDPEDHALAERLGGPNADDLAARIAAIRETIEEAGVAIGVAPLPGADALAAMRASLHDGAGLARALADAGAALDPAALVPFARWLPRGVAHRVFDTRFYLAELPPGAGSASADGGETVLLVWTTAAAMLAAADAGSRAIIYPTRRNLERLALFGDFADAAANARAHPVDPITPIVADRGGEPHLCIPDGLGYPVLSEPFAIARRG